MTVSFPPTWTPHHPMTGGAIPWQGVLSRDNGVLPPLARGSFHLALCVITRGRSMSLSSCVIHLNHADPSVSTCDRMIAHDMFLLVPFSEVFMTSLPCHDYNINALLPVSHVEATQYPIPSNTLCSPFLNIPFLFPYLCTLQIN